MKAGHGQKISKRAFFGEDNKKHLEKRKMPS
jgi:hypothetical protein